MERFALFTLLSVSYAATKEVKLSYQGDRYFFFPGDGDGLVHLIDVTEDVDEDIIAEYDRLPNNNNGYWLYTRAHPTEPDILIYDDIGSILHSDFDVNKTTVFLVHGWLGSGDNEMNLMLTEAFLRDGDVNVIVFEWSKLANRNYLTAKKSVATLGKGLGLFIIWIESLGVSYNNLHLVGFSLGGHIVGNAGRFTGSLVKRITALDPAGPLWHDDENRLKESDAQYVEVIHTNTLVYGYSEPCGHADFYPNGGSIMPGCWLNICSHSKGYEYMAMSVKYNNFHANECDDFTDVTSNKCDGDLYPMGNSYLNKSRSGLFRVDTG